MGLQSRNLRRLLLIGRWCLALLVGAGLLLVEPLGIAEARASTLSVVQPVTEIAASRRKKRKKKRRGKKKKRKKKKKKKAVASKGKLAMLAFEADGGGQSMTGLVFTHMPGFEQVDPYQMEIALAPGAERYSPASVRAALVATGTDLLVRGIGVRHADHVEIKIFAFAGDGKLRHVQSFTTSSGEMDPLALAPQVGMELAQALPGLANQPEVTGAEAAELSKPGSSASPVDSGTGHAATDKPEDKPESEKDQPTEDGDRVEPLIAAGVGFDLLYWSYELRSSALESTVNWHPLDPYPGGSFALALWPMDWLGVDLDLHVGMHSYAGDLPIDEESIEATAVAAQLALRARYLFGFGIGLGGHLGYRFGGLFVSAQTPTTIAPGFSSHQISPGLDFYATMLAPLLSARLSLDLVPWGLYTEAPDQPGESAGLWGWRVEGALRSIFFAGIYAEARLFYEHSYVTYSGSGDRSNFDGTAVADGQVTNGMRGLSLGLGWSF